ncbi:XdhC family protein [Candidatus Nephthysia bennettiae]|uniref:XdhC family protein n=1 Tax=Candidatus Nephthysia bennettiae TaxID=3127016 RepID=UPI0030C6F9CB
MAASRTPCALVTVVACDPPTSARPGDKAVVTADGRLRGWVGGSCAEPVVRREALRVLAQGAPCLVRIRPAAQAQETRRPGELTMATTCPSAGSLDIFIEPRLPRPLLLVFGDSPAAHAMVELGAVVGFRTCAVHPGSRVEDHPGADLVLPTLDLSAATPDQDTWAVVATMGHYDEDAIEACLAHPSIDVALVASGRRAQAVQEQLRLRGLDERALGCVRTPAGGVRGSTQEEIALFALAEVVAARRARREGAATKPDVWSAGTAPAFATDPVCGMVVDAAAALSAIHEGRTVYFCSAECRRGFHERPELFAERLEPVEH